MIPECTRCAAAGNAGVPAAWTVGPAALCSTCARAITDDDLGALPPVGGEPIGEVRGSDMNDPRVKPGWLPRWEWAVEQALRDTHGFRRSKAARAASGHPLVSKERRRSCRTLTPRASAEVMAQRIATVEPLTPERFRELVEEGQQLRAAVEKAGAPSRRLDGTEQEVSR